jgi:hypothetical protein
MATPRSSLSKDTAGTSVAVGAVGRSGCSGSMERPCRDRRAARGSGEGGVKDVMGLA